MPRKKDDHMEQFRKAMMDELSGKGDEDNPGTSEKTIQVPLDFRDAIVPLARLLKIQYQEMVENGTAADSDKIRSAINDVCVFADAAENLPPTRIQLLLSIVFCVCAMNEEDCFLNFLMDTWIPGHAFMINKCLAYAREKTGIPAKPLPDDENKRG